MLAFAFCGELACCDSADWSELFAGLLSAASDFRPAGGRARLGRWAADFTLRRSGLGSFVFRHLGCTICWLLRICRRLLRSSCRGGLLGGTRSISWQRHSLIAVVLIVCRSPSRCCASCTPVLAVRGVGAPRDSLSATSWISAPPFFLSMQHPYCLAPNLNWVVSPAMPQSFRSTAAIPSFRQRWVRLCRFRSLLMYSRSGFADVSWLRRRQTAV